MASPDRQSRAVVVVIDGEIGAGKTTLIGSLREALAARGLGVAVVPEPVDEWKRVGILQAFYEDNSPDIRRHTAYEFQTFTASSRIKKTREIVAANPDAQVFLLERSILTDRYVFMELQRELVGPMLMTMYDNWWEMWAELMPIRPTMMVYLKPSLGNCMRRVARRAREGEIRAATDVTKGDESETANASGADACADEDEDPEASARGGVSSSYQARLRRAHEAYLEGRDDAGEFAGMPMPRPFDIQNDVVVIEGALADDDFSAPGRARDAVVSRLCESVAARVAARAAFA